MVLTALAKKLFRTLAKVIPQCGMASQAVAFNMFLAFFAVLLTALSLMKGKAVSECHADFGGSSPRELATHIRVRVTPKGEHLVPGAYRLDRDAARWLGLGRGDRLDGVDGDLCNASLSWCGLELRKRYSDDYSRLKPSLAKLDEPEQAERL